MRMRKLSASSFTVGFLSTNLLIGSANSIITPTARMTAVIITHRSSTMPTAVITESNEKMMSRAAICTITAAKPACLPGLAFEPSADTTFS